MADDTSSIDAFHMRSAIALAMRGRGGVEPNPMVGCVIVQYGKVIGQGWHEQFGGPHAEPAALASCTRPVPGATIYVTLEPCCHTNKKTPPCVPRLIDARPARVVVGCADPNPQVSGRGIRQLRDAGIAVDVGILEPACRQLIAPFIALVTHHRPYVTLKWAQTADGKVAGPGGARLQVSNAASMKQVHELRARCDAIAVGIGTAFTDDPLLTARHVPASRPLVRIVLDRALRLPIHSQLAQTAGEHRTIIFHASNADMSRADALRQAGIELRPVRANTNGLLALNDVLADLGQMKFTHLLVEPGPTLARSFLSDNLADRAWVFHSSSIVGDDAAPAAARLNGWRQTGVVTLDADRLEEWLNPNSPVYFAPESSADLLLAQRS